MKAPIAISVIIPAMNEEDSVAETVSQIFEALRGYKTEVIVVNDGSSDDTAGKAQSAGATVISHPHNLGYGASLKSGISNASHDTIIITDADGTYPNELMPMLVAKFEQGFDMVVGARTGEFYRESILKSPLRLLLKFMVEFTAGRRIPDINSGFRIFSRREVIPYFGQMCNTFSFTTSMTLAYMMNAKFVTYFPIPYRKRVGKSKVKLFRDALRTSQYIVQAILYYNPLKLFLMMAIALLVNSFICLIGAWATHLKILYFFGVGSFLMTIIVFCFGLLADLLRQILTTTLADHSQRQNK